MKFRSDVAGTITGVRFYKASANTGTHVGNLWSSTGTLLATATFANETTSGWQQVNFATPVAITANTTYVASYHANAGHYSADINAFASVGVDNPPLHALASPVSSGNGVYAYGANSAFPSQTWNAANYWVDVVFTPMGSDTQAPTVAISAPAAEATVTGGSERVGDRQRQRRGDERPIPARRRGARCAGHHRALRRHLGHDDRDERCAYLESAGERCGGQHRDGHSSQRDGIERRRHRHAGSDSDDDRPGGRGHGDGRR